MNWLAAALLVVAVNIFDMGSSSASAPRWMVVFGWAILACLVAIWRYRHLTFDSIDAAAVICFAWFCLSITWSQDYGEGICEATTALALLCVFMWVRRFPDLIPEACLLALVVALYLQFTDPKDWGGHGNRNFQTETMVMLLCLGWQARRWLIYVPLSLVTIGYLVFLNPSKIEFFVALVLMVVNAGRIARNVRFVPGGIMVQQHSGVARRAHIWPRRRIV